MGIENIEYNVLNLPKLITFANGGTIRYTYSAAGEKLKAEYTMTSDSIIKTTDYCGNLIYEQGRPKMLLVDGGYVTFNDNANSNDSLSFGEGWGGASYHYYLTDHLGNNRVVVGENDSIEQVNHYYPYGGLMAESTGGDAQRYKYNGKELDRMHGLDWYDYGARWMNGLAFTTPDPKAWDYTDVSPYVYCHNNPISRIDPDGRDDYYTYTGQFLRSDDKETDYIKIGWSIEVGFPGENVTVNGGIPIEEMNLSAEAYSNIFTDVLSKMEDVDINEISNGKISIIKWDYQSNPHENLFPYEVQDSYNATNGSIGNISDIRKDDNKQTITAYIYPQGTAERKLYNSVSNVQNLLGVHEYLGHYKNGLTHNYTQHDPTFLFQQKHKSWRKTTQQFKNYEHSIYNK